MLERNSVILGIILGLFIPFVGYAIILTLFEQIGTLEWLGPETRALSFRSRTIAILAICLNLIPFNIYRRWRYEDTMRGIMISTIIYVFVWVYYFADAVF